MKQKIRNIVFAVALATLGLAQQTPVSAATVFDFPFNEGSGNTTTGAVNNLVGYFGVVTEPTVDYVTLTDDSPSGQPGDRSIATHGLGFLDALDTNAVLDIPSGPITLEAWVNVDLTSPPKNNEGIVGYGNSYKLGLKNGKIVFTLLGKVDITNTTLAFFPAGWTHVAAAWDPGVGVTFYVNNDAAFVANTNLARAALHNYLALGGEGANTTNSLVGSFDRIRVHHALLSADQIDSDAANPKPIYGSTLAHYDFNEASFPCTNSIAPAMPTFPSNDLWPTYVPGPAWTNDSPTGLAGDSALYFDYSNKPLIIPDSNNLISGTPIDNGYTMEAWVKLPSGFVQTNRMILFSYASDNLGFSLSINTDRSLYTTFYGKGNVGSKAFVPNDGNWHHVAAVYTMDTGKVDFYVDDQLLHTAPYTLGIGIRSGSPVLAVGTEFSNKTYFKGFIDRVRFSNQPLTPDQFNYMVLPSIPTVITNKNIAVNQSTSASFTISNYAAFTGAVTLSADVDNTELLPAGSISFGGSGADRTATFTPAAGKFGVSRVTLHAADGTTANAKGNTFAIKVIDTNVVAVWDFNSDLRDKTPSTGSFNSLIGSGIATSVNVGSSTLSSGMTPVADTDPDDNTQWRLGTFPAISTGNKTAGAQFTFSTVGFQNILFTWEHWNSASGSKYWRVQYSLDGVNFQDHTVYTAPDCTNTFLASADFNGIAGANNNPNFAVRLVAEFAGTATGQEIVDDNYIGARSSTPANYGPAGTLWLDMVKFTGEPYDPSTAPATLTVTKNGTGIDISWDATVSGTLESTSSLTSPNWQAVTGAPATVNGKNVITISSATGIQFFRLHQ